MTVQVKGGVLKDMAHNLTTAHHPEMVPTTNIPMGRFIGFGAVLLALVILTGLLVWWKRKFLSKCAMKSRHRKHDTNVSMLTWEMALYGLQVLPKKRTMSQVSVANL